jgi:hypothetical protein
LPWTLERPLEESSLGVQQRAEKGVNSFSLLAAHGSLLSWLVWEIQHIDFWCKSRKLLNIIKYLVCFCEWRKSGCLSETFILVLEECWRNLE